MVVSVHKVASAVASAVSSFNAEAWSLTRVMKELNVEPNKVVNAHLEQLDMQRVQQARENEHLGMKLAHLEKQQEKRREQAAQIHEEGPMYGPGIYIELWTVSLGAFWQFSNIPIFWCFFSFLLLHFLCHFIASLSYRHTAVHFTGIRTWISNHNKFLHLSMT